MIILNDRTSINIGYMIRSFYSLIIIAHILLCGRHEHSQVNAFKTNVFKCQKSWKLIEAVRNNNNHHQSNSKNINSNNNEAVQLDVVNDVESDLEICNKANSMCCTRQIEKNLNSIALNRYQNVFLGRLFKVKLRFINYASNFDAIIKEILDSSEFEFNKMINKTHASHHHEYSFAFTIFYEKLRKYYGEYPIDINNVLHSLLLNMTQAVFNLHDTTPNINHKFDIKCVEKNIETFDAFTSKQAAQIEKQLITSLQSLKLFSNGLTRARDMMIELYNKLEHPSDECKKSITKLNGCQLCMGDNYIRKNVNVSIVTNLERTIIDDLKPCNQNCINVYKKCIYIDLSKIEATWNNFLKLMNRLAFQIEHVIKIDRIILTLKSRIFHLASHFKTNGTSIVKGLFTKCGSGFTSIENIQKHHNHKVPVNKQVNKKEHKNFNRNSANKKISSKREMFVPSSLNLFQSINTSQAKMNSFIAEANSYFKQELTTLWSSLIESNCRHISSTNGKNEKCWNGTSIVNKSLVSQVVKYDNYEVKDLIQQEIFNKTYERHLESMKAFNAKISLQLDKISFSIANNGNNNQIKDAQTTKVNAYREYDQEQEEAVIHIGEGFNRDSKISKFKSTNNKSSINAYTHDDQTKLENDEYYDDDDDQLVDQEENEGEEEEEEYEDEEEEEDYSTENYYRDYENENVGHDDEEYANEAYSAFQSSTPKIGKLSGDDAAQEYDYMLEDDVKDMKKPKNIKLDKSRNFNKISDQNSKNELEDERKETEKSSKNLIDVYMAYYPTKKINSSSCLISMRLLVYLNVISFFILFCY